MNYYEMLLARKLAKGELPPNAYLLKEASGSLVSFSDGADLPTPSFICNITANQDLHGYDAPWVGGAGKNKLNNIASSKTENNITFTVNSDGSVKVYSTGATATTVLVLTDTNNPLIIQANKSYILSGCPNGGDYSTYELMLIATPTSGSAIVHDYGSDGAIKSSESDRILGVQIVVRSGQAINDTFYPMIRLASVSDATYAPYSNICPISGHTGVDAVISPTTEASAGTTIAVSWQTEAGEVYGGYVDLVSGVLVVTEEKLHFDNTNSSLWSGVATSSQGITRAYTVPSYSDREIVLSDSYIKDLDFNTKLGGININSQGRIIITPPFAQGKSIEEFKAELTNYPFDVVMTLATPLTYQLTPTQIKSLLGNNNAWCSTGDVDIDYFGKGAE